MELRPRKGRSVQPPSTPTSAIAKPSPRLPPQSSSRKKPASVPSTPIRIPSDNEDEDPKEIHVDLVDGATKEIHAEEEVTTAFTESEEHTRKQGNRDIILSDNVEFDTPVSSIARLRRAHIKGATSNVKLKAEATSTNKKKKMAKVLGATRVADTSIAHDSIAATSEKVGLDEAMAEKLSGFPSEDVASEEVVKQEAFTGIVPQKSDELAVEINLLAPQEVCAKRTEVLSPRVDSKQLHSSVKKSRKKRDVKSKVDDAKLDQDGHMKNVDDVDAPIVCESQGFSLILSDDEAVPGSNDAVRIDGREEKVSASKEAALENHLSGAEASKKASKESKKSQFHKKDIVEEEMHSRKLFEETSDVIIPCTYTKFDDQSRHELGLTADSSKEGVQELSEDSSDGAASSGEERKGDINDDHAKLDAAAASSQKNAVHDKECSSSNDDDGTSSSGSDDDDNEEDEMVSAFFSSMKENLQRISEPSGLNLQKGEHAKQDALVKLESQFTNCAVKKPGRNGRSAGYELSWSPEIAFSLLKTSKAQVGKPLSAVEARPDSIWGKDRCLQDGLCVPPVNPLKLNKLARKQKDDTAGAKWFNLSAPTITPEIKKELQLVKLRGALDPKRHYKADDSKGLPKYFQVGTVVGGPADFYSGRLTKKEQKSSLASELLSDSSLSAYRKRKYLEIQEQKQAGGKGFWKKKKSKRTPAWANI